jgi:hypothetical protein
MASCIVTAFRESKIWRFSRGTETLLREAEVGTEVGPMAPLVCSYTDFRFYHPLYS